MKKNVLIVVIIASAVIITIYVNMVKKGVAASANTSQTQAVIEVSALKLEPKATIIYEELPGRTAAYNSAEIRPQVSGIITDRLFEEGSYVEEGQQLYQINPDLYQATYDSALADLGKAEANVKSITAKNNRYKDLVKINAISKQEYDDIQASLAQAQADAAIAQAAIASAKINLNYTKVYAPISGRIGKSSVTKGALVTASQTQALASIIQLDPMYVDMTQSTADLMRLRNKFSDGKNIPVTLILDGEKESIYKEEGKLQFHEVTVDQTTGSVQLRALFPNPDKILLPGLFVRARLAIEYPDVILVPQKATNRNPDGSMSVWVIDKDNIINQVIIKADKTVDNQWVVTSGVNAGDTIVTGGAVSLKSGTKVKPVFAAASDVNMPKTTPVSGE